MIRNFFALVFAMLFGVSTWGTKIVAKGVFQCVCYDKDGQFKWLSVFPNGATTVGLSDMLTVAFAAGTQKTTWYMGLIDNASFSALSAGDTASSHAGWIENVDYDEATRPTWGAGTGSGGVITNASSVNFTMNASVTIKGAFLISNSTKSGTSGILFCTGLMAATQAVVDNDVLKFTYTVTLTPG
jgi:hypothetical protein